MPVYTITWSKSGDHKDQDPKTVTADRFDITDGFYVFVKRPEVKGHRWLPILSVRASDVAMVDSE